MFVEPKKSVIFAPFNQNVHAISNELRAGRQQDVHEFFNVLLKALRDVEIQEYGDMSKLVINRTCISLAPLFDISLEKNIICSKCSSCSKRTESSQGLFLTLQRTLNDSLKQYFEEERLTGCDKYECSNCNEKVEATMHTVVQKAPNILAILLKRFDVEIRVEAGRFSSVTKKIDDYISFPEHLYIEDFISNIPPDAKVHYKLSSVLVHHGRTPTSGHYYAFVNNKGTWYKKNDEHSTQATSTNVAESHPYLLFYTRQSDPVDSPALKSRKKYRTRSRFSTNPVALRRVDKGGTKGTGNAIGEKLEMMVRKKNQSRKKNPTILNICEGDRLKKGIKKVNFHTPKKKESLNEEKQWNRKGNKNRSRVMNPPAVPSSSKKKSFNSERSMVGVDKVAVGKNGLGIQSGKDIRKIRKSPRLLPASYRKKQPFQAVKQRKTERSRTNRSEAVVKKGNVNQVDDSFMNQARDLSERASLEKFKTLSRSELKKMKEEAMDLIGGIESAMKLKK